jgi:hypothetical protein
MLRGTSPECGVFLSREKLKIRKDFFVLLLQTDEFDDIIRQIR